MCGGTGCRGRFTSPTRSTNGSTAWQQLTKAATGRSSIAIEALVEAGPNLGRPLVDRIRGSTVHNLKELRPGSAGATEVRVLFVFDPWRSAILLLAGDKAGNWSGWYRQVIPRAEQLYEIYLKERATEEGTT